ncbi:T9SS type A sorting domain-containing protein [Kordia sp.]|uniref:T9SS type A sorting domain-containing protein n=1 Tax=Kordia sp. TaxID=1965332 RepID=UPI0025C0F496|nr:T9SS type A sorting domain-containing protein [Kordia sp.]MCH2196679.1 T9SS type A sorting domain-containing protein [Kordia sp.]
MKTKLLSFILLGCIAMRLHAQQFTARNVAIGLSQPREYSVDDIDGDGFLDIIVAEFSGNSISILYGTGNLANFTKVTLNGLVRSANGSAVKPWSTLVMDVDGDNQKDILFSNYNVSVGNDGLFWLRNTGNRTFSSSAQTLQLLNRCRGIYKANFDADPEDEIIIAGDNSTVGNIRMFNLNTTNSSISQFESYSGLNRPLHITSTDYNQDGFQDLIFTKYGTGSEQGLNASINTNGVTIINSPFPGSIDVETLIDNSDVSVRGTRKTIAFDFNEDGLVDFASVSLGNGNWTNLQSRENVSGTQTSHLSVQNGSRSMVSLAGGDFNNDNVPDIVVADNSADEILFFENTATSGTATPNITFNSPTILTSAVMDPYWIESADLDGDGDLDIIVTCTNGNGANQGFVTVFENEAIVLSTPEFTSQNIKLITSDTDIIISNLPTSVKSGCLYDISGRLIRTQKINSQNNLFALQGIQAGVYILQLSTPNTIFKIVKQ